ncbi:MAG: 2-C-methyl-D-erythritol 4-phosphate cytidylyltransferase [Treponema sp.]|jgi:2-C-methyl-D-erythritol 4-phosphate cytidylyltransferase|nr:2-C-methyl-D-erythritol 4-phosphate cytidylyltransferase [Treponema sp.]
METADTVAVVICAAGASMRMGGIKKEYQKLEDCAECLTVLGSAVRAFSSVPSVETIVIAVPENGESGARKALPPECLEAQKPKVHFVNGGKTRRASVFNALSFIHSINTNSHYVLIHDGARPWISVPFIESIIEEMKKHGAVVPLLPFTDTPKECSAPVEFVQDAKKPAILITRHLKRSNTGVAQTPQGFRFPEIFHAHEKAAEVDDEEFTDDAEIWGKFCGPVAVIPGSPENKKITFPEDFG